MNLVFAIKRVSVFVVAVLVAFQAYAISDAKKEAIAERLKPVGELCVQGDDACAGSAMAANAGPKDPADIYSGKCAACHDTGAGGAPLVGDASSWAPHIAKGIDARLADGL